MKIFLDAPSALMPETDLIVSSVIGGFALLLAIMFEERRIFGFREQSKTLQRLLEISESLRAKSDSITEHVRSQSFARLEALGPALKAAVSQYLIRAYVELGPDLTPETFLAWLKKNDSALDEAWATVSHSLEERRATVSEVLDSVRIGDAVGRPGVMLGRTPVPFGRPDRTLRTSTHLSLTARLAVSRWYNVLLLGCGAVVVVLGYPLLLILAIEFQGTVAIDFFAPITVALLFAGLLVSARTMLRDELASMTEYGVFFAPGEIGPTVSYVSFGEYSPATYFRPPDDSEEGGPKPAHWRRFSPNGLSSLGRNLDRGERTEGLYFVE
jgi:hypothetical protein